MLYAMQMDILFWQSTTATMCGLLISDVNYVWHDAPCGRLRNKNNNTISMYIFTTSIRYTCSIGQGFPLCMHGMANRAVAASVSWPRCLLFSTGPLKGFLVDVVATCGLLSTNTILVLLQECFTACIVV